MSLPDLPTVTPDSDAILVEALDELLAQSRDGRMPDLDSVIRRFPQLELEIRELWATMMIAEDFASFHGDLDAITQTGDGSGSGSVQALPREFADYTLLDEIGRGGMGIVYRARQKSPSRIVALKMVLRGDVASREDLARFRAEAEAAAKVLHPHIVPVYEVGEHEGRPYFSMKLIEGTTLHRKLADGPLPPRMAAEMLIPVCRAIADAHRRGVLHRDLKPSNILIDRDGRTYITDFGLAKRITAENADGSLSGSLTQSGAILGTPGYMAPEQAAGKRGEVGAASDVYALGAILYAMLTGRPPFQAASALDTVLMVLEQEPLPPRMLNPKADADLEMIALKCLQKPMDLRYASADALADDLQAFLSNEPIAARSSHFTQIITRAFRETHHAQVLENWGLLWMWHSVVVFVLCVVTNVMAAQHVDQRWPYVALWGFGVGAWAFIFWELRRRSGPITFVERQIAHVWAGSTIASTLLFALEWLLDLPVLTLSAVLPLIAGAVFLTKAGILSGKFYVQAAALFLTSLVMAVLHRDPHWDFGLTVFGVVMALCFAVPGWKYWRQRVLAER
ncbi:MAG: protein kinase [Planctomycetales bacterium 12-60-4]|nr:MAG: protein kinase [Planctomycetales bacterium 12-60-4]